MKENNVGGRVHVFLLNFKCAVPLFFGQNMTFCGIFLFFLILVFVSIEFKFPDCHHINEWPHLTFFT